ncbi:MAG: ParB N-terminal domain-containing protein, partial [Rhizobiales bacterium]|nr:ParB N-terminal domain-containing protein [Hyphomicrobiales bacterium]
MARTQLELSYVAPDTLTTDAKSFKLHPKRQIVQIAKSIETFDMIVPLLVRGSHVEVGCARLLACRQLGLESVPVIDVSHLSDNQVRAFKIADNQLCHVGKWDDQFLAQTLKDLSEQDLDFSLEVTGFDCGEIDFRIQSLDQPPKYEEPDPP